MIKTIAILAAAAAIAGPAIAAPAAAQVRITLAGKDDATLKAEVLRAAQTVCKEDERSLLATYYERTCIADTIKDTEAKISEARTAMAAAPEQLASR